MIQLMRKKIDPDALEVLYDRPFTPESLDEDFEIKDGKWYVDEEGWLVGENRNNSASMVMSKGEFFGDVLVEFDAATIFPATRDIDITKHGRVGFEAYCTKVKYTNYKVKRITYTDTAKPYEPEF